MELCREPEEVGTARERRPSLPGVEKRTVPQQKRDTGEHGHGTDSSDRTWKREDRQQKLSGASGASSMWIVVLYRSTQNIPKRPKTFMSLVLVLSPWYKLTQRVARHAVPGRGSDSDHAAKFIQSVHRQGQTNKSSPKKTKNNYNIVTISYDMLRKLCSLWFVFRVSHIWISIRPWKGRCHISVRTQNLVHQQCVHESSFLDWLQHASTCIFTPLRVGWPPTPQVYFGPWVGAPQAKNFHFSPPWGLPKLGNFHFSPPWGLPKLGNFHFSPPVGAPQAREFSLFPPVGAPQAREFSLFPPVGASQAREFSLFPAVTASQAMEFFTFPSLGGSPSCGISNS